VTTVVAFGSTSQSHTSAAMNVFVQNVGMTLLLSLAGSYWDFGTTNPITVTAYSRLNTRNTMPSTKRRLLWKSQIHVTSMRVMPP
jgi:hypothetical protein